MPELPPRLSRRLFLTAGAAAVFVACSKSDPEVSGGAPGTDAPPPTSAAIGGSDAVGPTATAASTAATPATTPGQPSTTTGASSATTTSAPSTGAAGPAKFITRGSGSSNNVALTFHTDGDLTLDQKVLDILAAHGAHVTNFIVGKWLDANPTWARKLTDAGHELANHTYNHLDYATLSPSAMTTEITKAHDVIARLNGGNGGRFFRPSGTDDGQAQPSAAVMKSATDAGYVYVAGWDVEPYDYKDPGANAVRDRVLAGVKPGSIVSLHFNHVGTVDALPQILDGLKAKNLTSVTLSQLIG